MILSQNKTSNVPGTISILLFCYDFFTLVTVLDFLQAKRILNRVYTFKNNVKLVTY